MYRVRKSTGKKSTLEEFESDGRSEGLILSDLLPDYNLSPFEKMERVKDGISKKDLEKLKKRTLLDYEKLSHALSVTRATLINKKSTEKYSNVVSERILNLADIYSYGYEVFEDESRFRSWMQNPNAALGGKKPYDIIDNVYGREEVKNLIGRIEQGVFS